uniref:ATP-dependent DNA helicase Q-like SIM n=1 Tax=Solanum tuberosum TaxID=4113 RepID=M1CB86_SOLTU
MDTMKFLKFDIPIMALTATATTRVREDILQSLHMSKATNFSHIVFPTKSPIFSKIVYTVLR